MSIKTELLVHYFCGNEVVSPEATSVRTLYALLLGASPPANEVVFVIYHPLSKAGDRLYPMKTTCLSESAQTLALPPTCCETGRRFHLHKPVSANRKHACVPSRGEASYLMCRKHPQQRLAHSTPPGQGSGRHRQSRCRSPSSDHTQDVQRWPNAMEIFMFFPLYTMFFPMQQRCPNVSWVP